MSQTKITRRANGDIDIRSDMSLKEVVSTGMMSMFYVAEELGHSPNEVLELIIGCLQALHEGMMELDANAADGVGAEADPSPASTDGTVEVESGA